MEAVRHSAALLVPGSLSAGYAIDVVHLARFAREPPQRWCSWHAQARMSSSSASPSWCSATWKWFSAAKTKSGSGSGAPEDEKALLEGYSEAQCMPCDLCGMLRPEFRGSASPEGSASTNSTTTGKCHN